MTQGAQQAIAIRSEEEAWQVLEAALDGAIPAGVGWVRFEGWPVLTITLHGAPFDASLTPRVMAAFIELQRKLNQTYAFLRFGRARSTLLTDEQKKRLEVVVRVEPGSSRLLADLKGAFETIGKEALSRMESRHIAMVVAAGALLYAGNAAWTSYLDHELQVKQIEGAHLAAEQETRRMEIFARAMAERPELAVLRDDAAEVYNHVLKGGADAEVLEINNVRLEQETVHRLIRPERGRAAEAQLNGNYRIRKVDSSHVDHFRVEVLGADGRVFLARLDDRFASAGHNKERLQRAEWDRQPVYLFVNAKELRGEVTQATIVGVEEAR